MKKPLQQLLAVASKLQHKYASIDARIIAGQVQQSIQAAIANASTIKSSGIMPFVPTLRSSNSTLSLSVTRNGDEISISNFVVNPSSEVLRFSALPAQIQAYLQSNLELFPTQRNGEQVVYNDFTVNLSYGTPAQNVARR